MDKPTQPARSGALGQECEHGQLARSCDLCDKDRDIEHLRGLVAQYKEDAERYRWLVENTRITPEHWGGRWSIVVDSRCPKTHDKTGIDAAIDKARKE